MASELRGTSVDADLMHSDNSVAGLQLFSLAQQMLSQVSFLWARWNKREVKHFETVPLGVFFQAMESASKLIALREKWPLCTEF